MAISWNSADITCPFYVFDDKCFIKCETIIDNEGTAIHTFDSRQNKESFIKNYCSGCHMRCPFCRALLILKYGEQPSKRRFV